MIDVLGFNMSFQALTIVDTIMTYPEIVHLYNITATHVALQFKNNWLSQYLRPIRVIFDQGPEFIGLEFQHMLTCHGIHPVLTTVKNLQANAICEHLHQMVANMLCTLLYLDPPRDMQAVALHIDTALQTASYLAQTAIHIMLKISPGALIF